MSVLFPNVSQEFVYVRSYSHWLENAKRRETWDETVSRYMTMFRKQAAGKLSEATLIEVEQAILKFEVMPSMRALWAAGPAIEKDNLTAYNCSYCSIDSVDSFAECLYILMCGAGFGFDVSQESVSKLPAIPPFIDAPEVTYIVGDSREAWADSVKVLMNSLYDGKDMYMDYSKIRPKGTRLKTMGGRSSGPEPLRDLHDFIRKTFQGASSQRLKSIECHDICNKIAEIVVVGGVRRSSEISLSDLEDRDMRGAKNWPFPPHRSMANNSAIYRTKPTREQFDVEWKSLRDSGTGERGIFNLEAARSGAPDRRNKGLIRGLNPCGEIMLRDKQFCNLSEVIMRSTDSLDNLKRKARLATIIGCVQSTLTYFPFLRKEWAENCNEERLLGVSLTGMMDAPHLLTAENLKALKSEVISTAAQISDILGVPMPAATTCCKPSGTVSQLVDSSSGCHPRYDQYYVRRYRISAMDPLFYMMMSQGFDFEPEVGQETNTQTWVVSFPVKAPEGCVTREAVSAMDQLKLYALLQENWAEHNTSLTVYINGHEEWREVGDYIYENWDKVKGISFLPYDNGHYAMAPYQTITKAEYEDMAAKQPTVDFDQLALFEQFDHTEGAKTVACSGSSCEI